MEREGRGFTVCITISDLTKTNIIISCYMLSTISGIATVAILAEVCQPADFQFIGLLICGLAMRLLLTPEGPSDPVIESIPHIPGLIPLKPQVCFLVCNDGKDVSSTNRAKFDRVYYERLFKKLCKLVNKAEQAVSLEVISFFEPDTDFYAKLKNCDFSSWQDSYPM